MNKINESYFDVCRFISHFFFLFFIIETGEILHISANIYCTKLITLFVGAFMECVLINHKYLIYLFNLLKKNTHISQLKCSGVMSFQLRCNYMLHK